MYGAGHVPSAPRIPVCGICRLPLPDGGLTITMTSRSGFPREVGLYCSGWCRTASETLMAIEHSAQRHAKTGAPHLARLREELARDLRATWFRRGGPDPVVVAEAVELADRRLAER